MSYAFRFIPLALAVVSFVGCQEVRADLTVVDEAGRPVAGAEARLSAREAIAPGWGWGSGRENVSAELTDENGQVSLRSSGSAGSASVGAEKEGYYRSSMRLDLDGVDESGEAWRLANDDLKLTLRRKVNPVPMYAKKVQAVIPVEGEPLGFDLMVGDWVAPHGGGQVSDLIMTITRADEKHIRRGFYKTLVVLFDVSLHIDFASSLDGIMLVPANQVDLASRFIWPYQAPLEGYQSQLQLYSRKTGVDSVTETNRTSSDYYFFRVRSEADQSGALTSALYGKIRGSIEYPTRADADPWIVFTYYLNPEPNSRNLEFDPQQNLFGELPPLNRVRFP